MIVPPLWSLVNDGRAGARPSKKTCLTFVIFVFFCG